MKLNLKVFLPMISLLAWLAWPQPTQAIVDPTTFSNNKVGVHLIDNSVDEASEAASFVNSSGGNWGYVTVVIKSNDRKHDQWQAFFDELRRRHLIPIVRIATQAKDDYWELPYDQEEQAWADFLNNLIWPVKNRYVVIYNEPNQGQEWGNQVDPVSYAKVLNKTIDALKAKNDDFFVINAGFDASAPQKLPQFGDEQTFLKAMNQAVPGIFNKLDGWDSHSYPNPGYVGSPTGSGRATVQGWRWELSVLKDLGLNKDLPVFITETGWKHAEGLSYDPSLPDSETVGDDFVTAFNGAWSDPQVVAVTPFLLNYQQAPFDHFSFKKVTPNPSSSPAEAKVLAASIDPLDNGDFYPQYQKIMAMPKSNGDPLQDRLAELSQGSIYTSLTIGQHYVIPLTFTNTGQSIWGETGPIHLTTVVSSNSLQVDSITLPANTRVEPGQNYTFNVHLFAKQSELVKVHFSLADGQGPLPTTSPEFSVDIQSPVVLSVQASLNGKKDSSGAYSLTASSVQGTQIRQINLDTTGQSDKVETPELLPDYSVTFTLTRPFYLSKTLNVQVHSGNNLIDFGVFQPDVLATLLHPTQLWKLLTQN